MPINRMTILQRNPNTHSAACTSDILRNRFTVSAVASALAWKYFSNMTLAPGNILIMSIPANISVSFSVQEASRFCILTAMPRSGLVRIISIRTDTALSASTISPIRRSSARMIMIAAPPMITGLMIC